MAHTCIMMAICSYKLDTFSNNRYANMISYLEMLKEALAAFTIHNAPLHSTAYYCLLASELYMAAASPRAYYEAALYILIAAPVVVKFPWLNALVLERCARYFLHSGNTRKYVLYELIAGNKFQKCGEKALLHSTVCYSNIMLLIQDEKWGDLIIYLLRKLSDQLQIHAALGSELEKSGVLSPASSLTPISSVCAEEKSLTTTAIQKRISKLSPQRGLLLLLHMLQCCTDASYIAGVQMEDEAMTVLLELMHKQAKVDGVGGSGEEESTPMNVHVTKEWNNCPGEEQEESPFLHARARRSGLSVAMPNYLLGDVPLEFQEMTNADTKASVLTTVENLQIPRIDTEATCLLTSINGNVKLMEHGTGFLFDPNAVSSLKRDIDGRGASCTYAHRSAAVANATLYHKAMLDTESLWWSAEMKSEKCSSLSTSNEANVFIDPIAVEELVEQSLTAEKGVTYQLQTEQRAKNSNNFKCPLLRVPFQEPIRVSLRVTNPLSMALLLTNVQVEILPMELGNPCHTNINNNQEALHTNCSSLFDIEKIECVLEPEETRVLVLSCTAIDSSTLHQKYEVNAVRYQLSESLIVRQCITKKGVLMQRTMAQRIDRVRDRDSSLQFEIIDAHPLLNINFLQNLPAGAVPDMPVLREIFAERQKNWTNEVLAGELVHTLLTIRNAGTSAAKNIQLKFNLPSVTASVLHSSKGQDDSACVQVGPLLKTQGVSCTVISLPEDTIIEVSQEIVLCVWFHLDPSPTSTSSATPNATLINSEGGVKQRVTLLVSYHPNTEDIATANTNDPGTKPRTSYTSADYVIFPSVHAHAKCVKKKSSIDEKLLVCNLYNQVVQNDSLSDIATGAGKSTRKPNVDLDFVDGGIAIDGILGLGNVAQTHANDKGIVGPTAFDVMAKPQEKITGGLHVSSLYSSCGSNDFVANKDHGQGTWLYKRQNGNSSDLNDPFSNILCANALQNEVIERLLCNKACSGTYKQLLQQRRTEMSLEQEEMEETGPRTISQVRKERRKNREEETLCNDNGSGTESLNVSKLLYPRSWSDLVELQSLNGSLSLVVVWRCMWQNRTRIGCHIICHVPFMATGALNTTLLNKTPLLDYAYGYGCGSGMGLTKGNEQRALQECLSIALHHNPRIYISQDSIAKLQVHVELYSIATIDLYVHIECGDKRYLPQTSKSLRVNRNEPAEHRLCSYNVGRYSNNTGLMLKAMRWETEAKHTNCLVKPYCMRTFVFNCSFTHSGIFDVNR